MKNKPKITTIKDVKAIIFLETLFNLWNQTVININIDGKSISEDKITTIITNALIQAINKIELLND